MVFIGGINRGRRALHIQTETSGASMLTDDIIDTCKEFSYVLITGKTFQDDPLMQLEDLIPLFKKYKKKQDDGIVEIWTSGMLRPIGMKNVDVIWNVHVRLKNSGISKEKRTNESVLQYFGTTNANFIFDAKDEDCFDEILLLLTKCSIKKFKVFIHPLVKDEKILLLTKLNGFNLVEEEIY